MTEALAFGAALAFAVGNVLQQRGTLRTSAGVGHLGFLLQLLRSPVWVVGLAIQVTGWLLQAVALDRGSLVVVQSICALSIVLSLPFGARLTSQRVTTQVVVGASSTVVGIVLFLAAGAPGGGTGYPGDRAWLVAAVWNLVVVGGCVALGWPRTGAPRALLLGAAAGICFAMQAALTKELVELLGRGATSVLSQWQTYALVMIATIGFVLWQLALKTDVLAPAMASSNAANLFAGVLLGVSLFGETLRHTGADQGIAIVGLCLAMCGVLLLSAAPMPLDSGGPAGTGAHSPGS